jgi:CRP/FNR family transcriptional regulator, cyclic AMP receptor protein
MRRAVAIPPTRPKDTRMALRSADLLSERQGTPYELAQALVRSEILHGLDAPAAALLTRQLRLREFRRGQVIYSQREHGNQLYIIITGKVKIARSCADGRDKLLAVTGPGDLLGTLAMYDPGPHAVTATAITDVCLATIGREELRAWIVNHPAVADQLLRLLARSLRYTDDHTADLTLCDVPARLAKQLLYLAKRFGHREDDCVRVNHGLTQEEIASLVGASRITVNKVLADFTQRGWIRWFGKTLLIRDADRLAQRAQTEAGES